MRADTSLRRRLVTACVFLAVVIGGVFAAAAYIIVEAVELELIEARLTRAGELLIRNTRAGIPMPPSIDLRFAVDDEIPVPLRSLKPGVHQIAVDDRILETFIAEEGGTRYAVIDDISRFEHLEDVAFVSLGVAFLAGVLLALGIARASANRVIAPLTALADAVQSGNLASHSRLLDAPDEVGVLGRVLQARDAQLAEALRRERLFTADVSHELRTPLAVVLGAAEVLSSRLIERPDLRDSAERIRRTTAEMSARVNALLQLARAPEERQSTALAMRALVEREIERCRPLLEGKPVSLALHAPAEVWVEANADLVAIAVGNLLRNACHFTRHGSVRVALAPDALVVEDTGPGVPESLRNRLFEPFVRGKDAAADGAGLGLSIVKRVADHLGWLVRLEDSPQGGSRFTLAFRHPA
jgi:signal transduction histidine kinase